MPVETKQAQTEDDAQKHLPEEMPVNGCLKVIVSWNCLKAQGEDISAENWKCCVILVLGDEATYVISLYCSTADLESEDGLMLTDKEVNFFSPLLLSY